MAAKIRANAGPMDAKFRANAGPMDVKFRANAGPMDAEIRANAGPMVAKKNAEKTTCPCKYLEKMSGSFHSPKIQFKRTGPIVQLDSTGTVQQSSITGGGCKKIPGAFGARMGLLFLWFLMCNRTVTPARHTPVPWVGMDQPPEKVLTGLTPFKGQSKNNGAAEL